LTTKGTKVHEGNHVSTFVILRVLCGLGFLRRMNQTLLFKLYSAA
jgi:hypothetical protein